MGQARRGQPDSRAWCSAGCSPLLALSPLLRAGKRVRSGRRPPTRLPSSGRAAAPRPCGRRSPPPVPGGAPLIAEPPRPAPPLVPAQLGSLTDSRSPAAGGRAEGSAESHAQPPAPPLSPARGRGGRAPPPTAARRRPLPARAKRSRLLPGLLPRARLCSLEEVMAPCRAGRRRKFADSAGRREERTIKKKKISDRHLGNFPAGRPRPEPQALKLWPPRVAAPP